MDQYVSIVPRLLPAQYERKKIGMNDQGYEYSPNRSTSLSENGQGNGINRQTSKTRTQLNPSHLNEEQEYPSHPNEHFYPHSFDNSLKGQTNENRVHREALKDNSDDQYGRNDYSQYPSRSPFDYKSFENGRANSSSNSTNKSTKIILIIFAILVALFALAALSISIYLLVKISNTTTSG